MSAFASALLATFLVSLISLGGILVLFGRFWNERNEIRIAGFAAGVLLATSFLDLLPEAIDQSAGNTDIFVATLAAIVFFFFAERFIHYLHGDAPLALPERHRLSSRYFILVGDGVHNFVDGVAIAASFLVSPSLGVATTLAVVAHEIPHEVADYGILIRGGYTKRRALVYNFLSALTAVLGAMATFAADSFVDTNLAWFIAASAGMFIYIAAANLIPELHHDKVKGRFLYGGPFLVGVVTLAILIRLLAG